MKWPWLQLKDPRKAVGFGIAAAVGCLAGVFVGELPLLAIGEGKRAGSAGSPAVMVFNNEFRARLEREGAKTGDVQISLLWNNYNDLDLHCIDPNGEKIFFGHRTSSSGGELDVDMNAGLHMSREPVENIYWGPGGAPAGKYQVYVVFYSRRDRVDATPFPVANKHGQEGREFEGSLSTTDRPRLVCEFQVGKQEAPALAGNAGGVSWSAIAVMGIWTALLAMGISMGLVLRQRQVTRARGPAKDALVRVAKQAALVGAGAGALSQWVFGVVAISPVLGKLGQMAALGGMGAILGWGMSGFIPNLPRRPAALAGLLGGLIGGVVLVGLAAAGAAAGGRLVGALILGFAIGLMVAIAEEIAREAGLIVHYGPGEQAVFSLGETPIRLGNSSKADVYLPAEGGFPAETALIRFRQGTVEFEDLRSGQVTPLRHGSSIQIGPLRLEIVTSKG